MTLTTTIKVPDELKARIQRVADEGGVSPHAFMLQALETETARAELDAAFLADAEAAYAETRKTGKVYAMEEVHRYIRDKASGKAARRPRAKKLRV